MQLSHELPDYAFTLRSADGRTARVNDRVLATSFILSPQQLVEGWPVQLPERTHAMHIGWSSEGPVVARVVVCAPSGCADFEREELLWYGLDGEWLEDMPRG